jgi:hypothetical protein
MSRRHRQRIRIALRQRKVSNGSARSKPKYDGPTRRDLERWTWLPQARGAVADYYAEHYDPGREIT